MGWARGRGMTKGPSCGMTKPQTNTHLERQRGDAYGHMRHVSRNYALRSMMEIVPARIKELDKTKKQQCPLLPRTLPPAVSFRFLANRGILLSICNSSS
jgi:hypothetical protein